MSLRGPSTTSTGPVWNLGRGFEGPNGASELSSATTRSVMCVERERAVEPEARAAGRPGSSRSSAMRVDRLPELLDARSVSSCRPAACLWPPKRAQHRRARLERGQHVEARDAAAGSVRHVAVDREHDRRPVERVHELRGDDADDAAVPALARHHEHAARPDVGIGLDRSSSPWRGCPAPPARRRVFSVSSCSARAFASSAMLIVGGEQQPGGDVGRAHAAGGVDARRHHEADVVAVDGLAREAGGIEQRPQAHLVRAPW